MTDHETPMPPIPETLRRHHEDIPEVPEQGTITLANCEAVLKSMSRGPKGIILKFEVNPTDFSAVMAVLPLNETMTLILEKNEVGA